MNDLDRNTDRRGTKATAEPSAASGPACRVQNKMIRLQKWTLLLVSLGLVLTIGCAKYNTYHNAKRSFDQAEDVRNDFLKRHEDPPTPQGTQRADYERAYQKAQKILDEYPGHSLTDDALFLQAKAQHRLEAYRQSIRKLDLLFQNYPATPYFEEALYIQGLNYLLIGALVNSQNYLERLAKNFPDSKYQAETRKVSGDNAFALRDWAAAIESYRNYLDQKGALADRDRVGLKLAECYWELEDYGAAAIVLQEVSRTTEVPELDFRARLLRARVHVRLGDHDIVANLMDELRSEAELYNLQGAVLLVQAESLVAQNRVDDVASLLEGMPEEWATPAIKARAAEMMGEIYMDRDEWDRAREQFQTALGKRNELEDQDRVRRLNSNLQDYLAAKSALPDAKGERVASLQLLQANALLFGFERPHMAATLYVTAAADTAAAATVAARAHYGAFLTYGEYLSLPDSAAIYRQELLENFPDSPQAYAASEGDKANLFGFLLDARLDEQAENFANLTSEELEELQKLGDVSLVQVRAGRRPMEGVRRQMVYLSRRDNLLFEPPQQLIQMISDKQQVRIRERALDAAKQAEFDSLRAIELGITATAAESVPPVTVDEFGNPIAVDPSLSEAELAQDAEEAAEKLAEEEKKKKKDKDWDFLR